MNKIFVVTLVLFISLFSVHTVSASPCTNDCKFAERDLDSTIWVCCKRKNILWTSNKCGASNVKARCGMNTNTSSGITLNQLKNKFGGSFKLSK